MSTHAAICRLSNNELTINYVHSDGYYSYCGQILFNYYANEQDVKELLALGDLSVLGESLESTIAYHRDRKEPFSSYKCLTNGNIHDNIHQQRLIEKIRIVAGCEYMYVFFDGEWFGAKWNSKTFTPLKSVLERDINKMDKIA